MGRKLGRPKKGEGLLTPERILRTGLTLVDQLGIEELSMRRLAAALGVDPMAIYRHLPDKKAVLAGIIELVFNELKIQEDPAMDWPNKVKEFGRAYHNLARSHPNLVIYLILNSEVNPRAIMAANELLFKALEVSGLEARLVVRAADAVIDLINGFVLAESSNRLGKPGERQELLRELEKQPAQNFPALHRVLGSLKEEEILADFEGELDFILKGIEAKGRK